MPTGSPGGEEEVMWAVEGVIQPQLDWSVFVLLERGHMIIYCLLLVIQTPHPLARSPHSLIHVMVLSSNHVVAFWAYHETLSRSVDAFGAWGWNLADVEDVCLPNL